MPGLYFHIPFCRKACTYCDFHFSTTLTDKARVLDAMRKELEQRSEYLGKGQLNTIYFGGGTPSLLTETELQGLMETAERFFNIQADAEISLEVNPDDVNADSLAAWKRAGINRLSLGLQSFDEQELAWMKRSHLAGQSVEAVRMAQDEGFDNISVDLIYGSKWQSEESWMKSLQNVLSLEVNHISAYNLTIEPKTELGLKHRRKQEPDVDENLSATQFRMLRKTLLEAGYEHYEISNFAKPGFASRHNRAYWRGETYLGIGPSAHSFDGRSRQWNLSNNPQYCKALENGLPFFEREELSARQRYNEYVMTGLRNTDGCDLAYIRTQFGENTEAYFLKQVASRAKWLNISGTRYTLNEEGLLLADALASDLFLPA